MACIKNFLGFCIIVSVVVESFAQDWQSILNGVYWNDINGNTIEAHGGAFIKVGDTYYWVGEDKSHNSHQFNAVNCYSSKDLANWEFRNAVLTHDTHPDLAITGRVIERPKVIYNDSTGEYVMWLHWESSDYGAAECGIAKSSTIDGNYELVNHFRPNNNMSRDCALFKDDDSTAYFISAANENADLIIYELTEDYLDIERQVVTLWPGAYREAPAIIKNDGLYYLFSSGATGWDPNQAKYATATSIEGPWSGLLNIGNQTTYDSQSTYILSISGTDSTTYIFCADRWQDPDLKSSKYIWLPLQFDNGSALLNWEELWQINTITGELGQSQGDLPATPGNLREKKAPQPGLR
jgi:beta-xylosidase